MSAERAAGIVAGTAAPVTLALAVATSSAWRVVTALIGSNIIQRL